VKTSTRPAFREIRHLCPTDPDWPAALGDLRRPVERLEVAGTLPDPALCVAIVGTRFCDPWAAAYARELAGDLVKAGRVVVSGGAVGIDTAAHQGALDAGGSTVAVLPSGLGNPYPGANRGLFQRAAQAGCVLSELGPDDAVGRHSFLERNRLVAALSSIVIVVQAPVRSGSLSTAAFAKQLNRMVFAVPAAPWDPRGQGCLALLQAGAGICRSAADVLSLTPQAARSRAPRAPNKPKKVEEHPGVDADQRAVIQALAEGPMGADDLCERAGIEAPRVQRAILMLLLSKVIHEAGGGRYERSFTS